MKSTNTKKDFHDTLKYGKSYVYYKKYIDILCEAITNKLDGKYSIKYIAQHQMFVVGVFVPSWGKLPLYTYTTANCNDTNKNLFMTAYHFANQYLDADELFWSITNCQIPGRAQYHISPWEYIN